MLSLSLAVEVLTTLFRDFHPWFSFPKLTSLVMLLILTLLCLISSIDTLNLFTLGFRAHYRSSIIDRTRGIRLQYFDAVRSSNSDDFGPDSQDKASDDLHDNLEVVISPQTEILRRIDSWACVSKCGACCKLGPLSSRPDLNEYLSEEDFERYKSMIGDDEWCVNFDKESRKCTIYEERPGFCTVALPTFQKMYGIEEEEFSDFCTFCCSEQITDVYGEDSDEMQNFQDVIIDLSIAGGDL